MPKRNMAHVVVFRKIVKISTVISFLALTVSFFLMPGFIKATVGLLLGNLVAMFKVFFTFYSISVSIDPETKGKKNAIILANSFGYILMIALFILTAMYDMNMLIFSLLGIFIVYLSIVIHTIFEAFKAREDKAK